MTFEDAVSWIDSHLTWCPAKNCNGCRNNREALEAVKKEGDSRAAEMRERCALKVRTALHRNGHHLDANKIADQVRALELTEAKGNG